VNRTLKGDRRAPNSLIAERAAIPQTVIPKTIASGIKNTPALLSAPEAPEAGRRPTSDFPAANTPLLDGCESAFSAITDRQLADIPGRCMAALPAVPVQMAKLN
jgi:hypothetical protein